MLTVLVKIGTNVAIVSLTFEKLKVQERVNSFNLLPIELVIPSPWPLLFNRPFALTRL